MTEHTQPGAMVRLMMEEREQFDHEAESPEAEDAEAAKEPFELAPPGVQEYPMLGDTADPGEDEGSFTHRPPGERGEPRGSRWSEQ
jgi:hypothetical protein